MKYLVRHETSYLYSEPVLLCHNEVHLSPRVLSHQSCSFSELNILPEPAVRARRADVFGNSAVFLTIQERHQELRVTGVSSVEVRPMLTPSPALTPPWEQVRDGLAAEFHGNDFEALQFLYESAHVRPSPILADYALQSFTPGRPILDGALDLTHRIHTEFEYDRTATNMQTSLEEVFTIRRGVCQDFAHLELSCLRSLGLAARYVSGYMLTTPAPGAKRLIGADASHAWLAIYCPGFGWVDLDPTNDLIPSDKHVTLAWGRDYADVCPIKGVTLGGGKHSIQVSVDLEPL